MTKKYLGVTLGIIIVTTIILCGANYWVKGKLQAPLDKEVEEGNLTYESLSVNIFTNKVIINHPHWTDQRPPIKSKDIKINQLKLSNLSYLKLFLYKNIEIGTIQILGPKIIVYPTNSDTLNQKNNVERKFGEILFKSLEIKNGSFQYFANDTTQLTLSYQIPYLKIDSILIDSNTMNQSIPFQYENYSLSGESFFYRMNDLYNLKVKEFSIENGQMNLDSLQIKSRYDKFEFQTHIPHQKSWVDLCIPQVEISNANWTLKQDSLEFSATQMRIQNGDLFLFKDNRLNEYPHIKPLYSKMIRELPIGLNIDSIDIIDGAVTFQVRSRQEPPPGLVYFDAINGKIAHLDNVNNNQPDHSLTTVSVNALFMEESNIQLNWEFDVDNLRDEFHVSGTLSRIGHQAINYFVTPVLNISAEGAIDYLAFNFTGNDEMANGDVYVNYDDLKINLLKKDGSKRSRWISAIFNFILTNHLDGPIEKKDIKVERKKSKSFWNYLWEMVKEGTLKSIM